LTNQILYDQLLTKKWSKFNYFSTFC